MFDLTSNRFDPKKAYLASNDEKEFRANLIGIAQMERSELSKMVGESPYEAYAFVNTAKDQVAKLREELALLEWGIGRVQLNLNDVNWETSTLSIKTLEKISRVVRVPLPEDFKNPDND